MPEADGGPTTSAEIPTGDEWPAGAEDGKYWCGNEESHLGHDCEFDASDCPPIPWRCRGVAFPHGIYNRRPCCGVPADMPHRSECPHHVK